jgi:hypothetical protein
LSGAVVTPSGLVPAGSEEPRAVRRLGAWRDPVALAIASATLLALGLRLYQLSRPGMLLGCTEYDDGQYFGSAVRLIDGVLPYRDYIFVQPPGITLLMLPAALVAKLAGTAAGMAVGRVLTTLASTAGVALLGLLVRHRGLLVTIVACGVLAVFPDSALAAHTVLVEPWLVLLCLLGGLALFEGDRLTGSRRRLLWSGIAFGVAGAVESWAVVVVVVVLALCLPRLRRATMILAGTAAGFGVLVLPFAALAPRQFYQGLITAQIGHRAAATRVPVGMRFADMTGLNGLGVLQLPSGVILVARALAGVALAVAVMGGVMALRERRLPTALESFALATTVLIMLMFLWPSQFQYHFSAFLAPFLALAIALPVPRLLGDGVPGDELSAAPGSRTPFDRRARQAAAVLACFALTLFAVLQVRLESMLRSYISPAAIVSADRVIPPGACVATDLVDLLILANRFVSDVPGCSKMMDGLGTDLALSGGLKPGTGAGQNPSVAAVWRQEFAHARYAWLSRENSRRVAWSAPLRAYFHANFALVLRDKRGDLLYERRRSAG